MPATGRREYTVAKYGSADVVIEIDGADGGALVNISQHVQEINDISVERLMEDESQTFGDAWFEALQTGIRRMQPIEISGYYDDTAITGPDAILNVAAITHAVTRTFAVTYGSTKKTTVEVWIAKYVRKPTRGKLTRYSATLTPTGAPVEV